MSKKLKYEDVTDDELFYLMCKQRVDEKITSCRGDLNRQHSLVTQQQMMRQQHEAAIMAAMMHKMNNP